MENVKGATPVSSPKDDAEVGNGMSKREARRIRMRSMNKSEIAYIRRKRVFEAVWPFFRFFILFGLCFVILYPLIYMISCAFRDSADMSDPTVMWIPRHLTLEVIKETAGVMDIWKTLGTTLLLNIGCSLVQVASCALAGYGFARFKFKGKGLLFGIVVMMILVPSQIIAIPQYMLFRHFGLFGLEVNLINSKSPSPRTLDTRAVPPVPIMKPIPPSTMTNGIIRLIAAKEVFPEKFETNRPSTTQ